MPSSSPSTPSPMKLHSISPFTSSPPLSASNSAMDLEVKNTSSSTANTSPDTSTSSTSNARKRATGDVIAKTYPRFDPQAAVIDPFNENERRDAEFTEQFTERALLLLLKTQAWSSAHHIHQSQREAGALEKDINDAIAIELEQGRSLCPESIPPRVLPPLASSSPWKYYCSSFTENTRERLRNFIERMTIALAALSGL